MTHNIFFISDSHFGHKNVLTFKRNDGTPLRDFTSIEEHDEHLVERWNATVRPCDKIYHLGDVAIHKRALPILDRLNGKKRLVMGNHDVEDASVYLKYFENVCGSRILEKIIFTHIPIDRECLGRFRANVHGHLHSNVMPFDGYINVSVEQINYTPISLDEILTRL